MCPISLIREIIPIPSEVEEDDENDLFRL